MSNYQGYGNQPGGYPPAANPGYPPAANPGYPPAANPGYPAPQQQQRGYPPVAQEGYQTRAQGYPPAQPSGTGYPPAQHPPPAGKYVAGNTDESPESMPSAPPLENMDQIEGYGGNDFSSDASTTPPSYEEAMRPPDRSQPTNFRVPVINEETARSSLLKEVDTHCCWGKGPVETMKFLDLQSSSAVHYTLESFTEARTTKWTHEPYMGQPIDSPVYGPAPMPWNVQVPAPTNFNNNVLKVEVPHTASIKPCHTCRGMGRVKCQSCNSTGWEKCHACHGHGKSHDQERDCHVCNGHGRKHCIQCHGNGTKECYTCKGRAQLKCYIRLTVTWTNRFEDYVYGQSKLPIELLRKVNGEIAFQEEYPKVYPLTTFPDAKVNNASKKLVEKHSTAFPTDRIIMQRHKVRIIPITEVTYKHKDNQGNYLVYGYENMAYITDYPSTCCGCCNIL